ncbi:MAG: hypothetical protein ACKV2Q_01445 [Planctomycetaceae bacterium]
MLIAMRKFVLFSILAATTLGPVALLAQEATPATPNAAAKKDPAAPGNKARKPAKPGEVTLDDQVRGAFRVEPVVHRFEGRKGQVIPFEFPSKASEKDYPAQAAAVAQIATGISASPAQVELSLQRGGERFVSVVIANQSTESYAVNAAPLNRDRTPADWFLVRPQTFDLPPGTTRKVLVSMSGTRDPDAPHQYGLLNFDLADAEGKPRGNGTVDVGLLARTETNPQLSVGNLAWDGAASPPAIVLPLQNKGAIHFPLNARMSLSDADGHVASFGRWLLPNDATELRFRMKDALPGGRYTLRIQIDTKEGLEPIEITTPVELTQ